MPSKYCFPTALSSWQETLSKIRALQRWLVHLQLLSRHPIPTALNHIFALSLNHMWDLEILFTTSIQQSWSALKHNLEIAEHHGCALPLIVMLIFGMGNDWKLYRTMREPIKMLMPNVTMCSRWQRTAVYSTAIQMKIFSTLTNVICTIIHRQPRQEK